MKPHQHHHGRPEDGTRRDGHRGRRGKRLFDYGELRLLVLAMIAERPRHGYEIIKDITQRFDGRYAPSPGVIYPTLAWLEDTGYITVEADGSGRKLTRLRPEGEAFLIANRTAVEDLLTRRLPEGPPRGVPDEIERAFGLLKATLRGRLDEADDPARTALIAAAITEAARKIAEAP